MKRVAVVGLGYWGPNLARNFDELGSLAALCDLDEGLRERYGARYPNVRVYSDYDELLADESIDGVVIATPVPTHYELAKRALGAGKHALVEKPPAMRGAEMEELVALAEEKSLVLMPGHLLLYHPGVRKLKELLEEEPSEATAHGRDFLNEGVEDVVFCYLRFPSGRIAHMHLSWLDPHKMRRITVVGREKMVVFDDMELEQKVTIYDKAPESAPTSYGEWLTRSGDVFSPKIPNDEPLKLECQAFLGLMEGDGDGRKVAHDGMAVVRTLERLQASLDG